jgi:hypothetical protein
VEKMGGKWLGGLEKKYLRFFARSVIVFGSAAREAAAGRAPPHKEFRILLCKDAVFFLPR